MSVGKYPGGIVLDPLILLYRSIIVEVLMRQLSSETQLGWWHWCLRCYHAVVKAPIDRQTHTHSCRYAQVDAKRYVHIDRDSHTHGQAKTTTQMKWHSDVYHMFYVYFL